MPTLRRDYAGSKRRESKTVRLRRETLTALGAGIVDGFAQWGQDVIDATNPPDAPPLGRGLIRAGGWIVFADGKRLAGTPGATFRNPVARQGITTVVGFPFPARFQELGTINQPARPFLTPVLMAALDRVPATVRARVQARLRGR